MDNGEIQARVRSANERLVKTVESLDEASLRSETMLPGWTRAHVLVHLSRNADAHRRMIGGALRGELVRAYVDGAAGREREITEGVKESGSAIIAGLRASLEALDEVCAALPESAWGLETAALRSKRTIAEGMVARWREVEIHHADLGLGYGAADWPADFVALFLPRTIGELPSRARPEAAGFRWRLTDRDSGRSWLVDAESVREGAGPADAEVLGTGWQLLAWVSGRGDQGLDISDSPVPARAARLPEVFPHF